MKLKDACSLGKKAVTNLDSILKSRNITLLTKVHLVRAMVHSEGDQPCDFFGRNDAKAETPVLWPPHAKSWLFGKDSDAGRNWGQEEKGTTEDEMAGWHHRLDGRESEWTPGVGDGQGGLACCNSWGHKESDMTERLNWTELMAFLVVMWELDHKEGWVPKNWCFQIVVLEKTRESLGLQGNQTSQS